MNNLLKSKKISHVYRSVLILGMFIGQSLLAQPGIISTVSGIGIPGSSGDGGPATGATHYYPAGVCLDGSGNLFIADQNNNRIRKVDGNTGMISTVAGSGTSGFSGDGGPAISATLNRPTGVFMDGSGNLFIADKNNHRIRKVDGNTGIISTVAGTGSTAFNGDGGPAISATLYYPSGVCMDGSGNLFIADKGHHRIRKVDGNTGIISTVAGTGGTPYNSDGILATVARLYYPAGVCLDGSGNLFIADQYNYRIRKVDGNTGIISTVAGTGGSDYNGDGIPAISATIDRPTGVCMDGSGNFLIADQYNHRIRKVDGNTGIISTVAGTGGTAYNGDGGPAISATLNRPTGVCMDGSGNLFMADQWHHRIRKVSLPVAGTGTETTTTTPGYVFLADEYVKINGPNVSEGNIFANRDIKYYKGRPSTHTGNLTAVDDITIKQKNTIDGDVTAGNKISNKATVTGTVTPNATVAAKPMPILSFSAGGSNVIVPGWSTETLSPGSYKDVKVHNHGTLYLSSGEYFMNKLELKNSAKLCIDVSAGPVTLNIVNKLKFGKYSGVEISGGGSDQVTFNSKQTGTLDIGYMSHVFGSIVAPKAKVRLNKVSDFMGSVCAQVIHVSRDASFRTHSTTPLQNSVNKQIDIPEIEISAALLPTKYELNLNYPNPFNPTTTIRFGLPEASMVSIKIYNINGQLVRTLANGYYETGYHNIQWDATNDMGEKVASGVYIYKMQAGTFVDLKRMIFMK